MAISAIRTASEISRGEKLFLAVSSFLVLGGLGLQLSGIDTRVPVSRESAAYHVGSLMMQLILGVCYLGATIFLLLNIRIDDLLKRTWPIFLLPALALLSMNWSPDAFATFRKAIAFLGTVMLGVAISSRLSQVGVIQLIVRVLGAIVLLSVLWVFLFPTVAIHQLTDAWPYQAAHAGSWRGVVGHRTTLGHLSGLALALVVFYGSLAIPTRFIRYAVVTAAFTCLIRANSGGGFLTAAGLLSLLFAFSAVPRVSRVARIGIVWGALLIAFSAGLFGDEIIGVVLEILGKDPDLTGRTPFWGKLLNIINERPILGYSYYAGFAYEVGTRILRETGNNFINPHNGYLSMLTAFGYTGLAAGIFMLTWLCGKSGLLLLRSTKEMARLNAFPLAIVTWGMSVNVVEDALISGNDVVVLLLAIVAGIVGSPSGRQQVRHRGQPPARSRAFPAGRFMDRAGARTIAGNSIPQGWVAHADKDRASVPVDKSNPR